MFVAVNPALISTLLETLAGSDTAPGTESLPMSQVEIVCDEDPLSAHFSKHCFGDCLLGAVLLTVILF